MSSLKVKFAKVLEAQKVACSKAIGGTSKSAKNTRKRITSVASVDIPAALFVTPAPVEVIKEKIVKEEVIKEVEVEKIIKETNLQVTVVAVVIAGVLGVVFGAMVL